MIDFLGQLIMLTLGAISISYVTSKAKIFSYILFVIMSASFGSRLVYFSHGFFSFIFNFLFIGVIYFFVSDLIKSIVDNNKYNNNVKALNSIKKATKYLHALFILITLLNIKDFKEDTVALVIGSIICYVLSMMAAIDYDVYIKHITTFITSSKVTLVRQITENKSSVIKNNIPQNVDADRYLIEAIEYLVATDNLLVLLKNKRNLGESVLVEKRTHFEIESCLKTVLKNKNSLMLDEAVSFVNTCLSLEVEKDLVRSFINLDYEGVRCFENVILSEKMIIEINGEIKTGLDQDSLNVGYICNKYNITTADVDDIANYYGISMKIV